MLLNDVESRIRREMRLALHQPNNIAVLNLLVQQEDKIIETTFKAVYIQEMRFMVRDVSAGMNLLKSMCEAEPLSASFANLVAECALFAVSRDPKSLPHVIQHVECFNKCGVLTALQANGLKRQASNVASAPATQPDVFKQDQGCSSDVKEFLDDYKAGRLEPVGLEKMKEVLSSRWEELIVKLNQVRMHMTLLTDSRPQAS